MKMIYKYRLAQSAHESYVKIDLPKSALVRHVGEQQGQNWVWIEFDMDDESIQSRYFLTVYTGDDFNYSRRPLAYLGTILKSSGLVHHIYEELP